MDGKGAGMKRVLWLAAALVVLVSNAWVLVSASWNRGDAIGGTVELTERELRLQPLAGDSTAFVLELRWDVDANEPDDDGAPGWLNTAKLQELGFDCRVPVDSPHAREHYRSLPPAWVYVVLEFDGGAARKPGRRRPTRLVAVDVGHDPGQLRTRYPDLGRHIISRGVVKPFLKGRATLDGRPLSNPRLSAQIQSLQPTTLFVPPPHHRVLQDLRRHDDAKSAHEQNQPRYAATVSWGRRYEPWIRNIRLLPALGEPGPTAH
jgi:hypothetical protein